MLQLRPSIAKYISKYLLIEEENLVLLLGTGEMGRDWEFGEIKGGRRQRRKERVKETRIHTHTPPQAPFRETSVPGVFPGSQSKHQR